MRTRELSYLQLYPQQEMELVQYIEKLTERYTSPSRTIIRNFALLLAVREVSESWVTRFLSGDSTYVKSWWQTGLDRDHHEADSETKYSLYFELLHDKIKEYNVEPSYVFNMDEKRFKIGVLERLKRVFDKKIYNQKGVTITVQDNTRQWFTVLACICLDSTALSLSLIF
jgi:hypothetical protein